MLCAKWQNQCKKPSFNLKSCKCLFLSYAKFMVIWKWNQIMFVEHLKKLVFHIKPWMFRGMIKSTSRDISNLLKNQNVDEDIIRRWEEYGKEKIIPRMIQVRLFQKFFIGSLLEKTMTLYFWVQLKRQIHGQRTPKKQQKIVILWNNFPSKIIFSFKFHCFKKVFGKPLLWMRLSSKLEVVSLKSER